MASEVQIGGADEDRVFLDTDWTKKFAVADIDTDPTGATAKNLTGKTIIFDVRKKDTTDTAGIKMTKTCTLTGSFNSVYATNTQRAVVTVTDTDMTIAIWGKAGGIYRYSLKITDASEETILAYGDFVVERVTQAA